MIQENYKRKLATGSLWITFSEALKAIAALASSLVAARVLAPRDFGLLGVVLLTIAILDAVSQAGHELALVQRQKSVTPFLNVAWTIQLGRGLLLASIIAVLAPFLADWYGEPVLKYLLWAATARVIFTGLNNIGTVFFSRELDFKSVFIINGVSAVAHTCVVIPAILYFRNVWALIIGTVAAALTNTIVSYVFHPFRPKLEWDWEKVVELSRFGKWITGLTMIGFVITQGDDIFVSRYLGVAALGFYQLAYELSNLPATKITHVISKVSFPTYSRLQGNDQELREAFLGVMKTTLLLSSMLSVVIWKITPGVVSHIIGDKWAPIINLVQILVVAGFLRSINALGGALFQGCNRPDLDFKMNFPRFLAIVGLIWPFSAWWGLTGACFVVLIAIIVTFPIWLYGIQKLVQLKLTTIFRHNLLAAVSATVLAGSFTLIQGRLADTLLNFVAETILAIGSWIFMMWVIGKLSPLKLFDEVARVRSVLTGK